MNIFEVVLNILSENDTRGDDFGDLTYGDGLVMELKGSFEGMKFLFDRGDVFADFVHEFCKGIE